MHVMDEPETEFEPKERHPDSPLATLSSEIQIKNEDSSEINSRSKTKSDAVVELNATKRRKSTPVDADKENNHENICESDTIVKSFNDKLDNKESDKNGDVEERCDDEIECSKEEKEYKLEDVVAECSNNVDVKSDNTADDIVILPECGSVGPNETRPEPDPTNALTDEPNVEESNMEAMQDRSRSDSGSSQDSTSVTNIRKYRKRKSDSEEPMHPSKKLQTRLKENYPKHETIICEYIETSGNSTLKDIVRHMEQLLSEIQTLSDMAKVKEQEWNNILHLQKVKEEILMRLTRRKEVMEINESEPSDINELLSQCTSSTNSQSEAKPTQPSTMSSPVHLNNSGLMMVPIVSSNASMVSVSNAISPPKIRIPALPKPQTQTRVPQHILPKPHPSYAGHFNNDLNGHLMGRQGPIKDVKSIIADYRQRHPEAVPRRGRRMKSILNTQLGLAPGVATIRPSLGNITESRMSELGLLLTTVDGNSRPSSADSSHSSSQTTCTSTILAQNKTNISFKDVLVEFAKMSQSERQELGARASLSTPLKPPPPGYPDITLHPVTPTTTESIHANNSLLHGILTKSPLRPDTRMSPFSPTLARLLTAPERISPHNATVYQRAASCSGGVNLSTSSSGMGLTSIGPGLNLTQHGDRRSEITITPVPAVAPPNDTPVRAAGKQDILNLDDYDGEDDNSPGGGRLVIDEEDVEVALVSTRISTSGGVTTVGDGDGEDVAVVDSPVPACQGCNRLEAHYVCAGCGNQWYCSRECQVKAWEVHSEVCKG